MGLLTEGILAKLGSQKSASANPAANHNGIAGSTSSQGTVIAIEYPEDLSFTEAQSNARYTPFCVLSDPNHASIQQTRPERHWRQSNLWRFNGSFLT